MQIKASPSVTRYGLLLLLTIQNTATVLCMRASMINASAANQKYLVSTLVLTMETIKITLITALIVVTESNFSVIEAAKLLYKEILCRPLEALPLAVPSFLYVVQDNLIIYALSCVDATTYQVTYQARILTTALFARILLNQVISVQRWLSLLLLMSGVILTQVHFHQESGDLSFRSNKDDATYWLGLLAIGCATMTSGFAGVYNEKIIKNGQQPLLLIRSFQLSLFCVFFALMGVVIKDGAVVIRQGYFHGYTPFVWLIAAMQAVGGILVAGTMKYADNILKTFATANSIALSCVLSHFLLGDDDTFTPTFLIGTCVIILATFLYSANSVPPKN
ncbi:UDP-N-acetylglucosamine transporter-like isoform X2 [Daphnia pulex]|uniref:UDP-N-acetylglucosamine transporter-like isoform X2 n=2 Tax=Daphnia pulex TaxID=6669 RepID=UPI001EE0C3CD|nr:UDP-N-acetylglucosamine transporter-like isoform X2 [Daphnia pulex]XP_046447982.1 UDP-N-acetylglucosamine transporter-like isoform X2 [Daphnia pulex]XP_046447984.1 UDP-N-acetylglucosamine transporter-like isoform X2 [Daphnia pulex]XP_046447985.1 UDP-N-acetylglucosamine transporter-like isoform X2 [Daphnia pulex]